MRRIRYCLSIVAWAFAATIPMARGGVVPISRNSLVVITGQAKSDDLGKSKSTGNFSPFDQSITSTGGDGATTASGTASQNTFVDASTLDRLVASGSLSTAASASFSPTDTSGPLNVHASSNLILVFNILANSEPFAASIAFADLSPAGATSFVRLDHQAAPGTPASTVIDDRNVSMINFDESLKLAPGIYTLTAQTDSGSSGSSPQNPLSFAESHAMNFSVSIGSGGATAVPLPATVWTGSALLLAVMSALFLAERRRHA